MAVEKKTNIEEQESQPIGFIQVRAYFLSVLKDIIDLSKGVDKIATIKEIKNKKSMAGANAWMLICSIVIASIGLDNNSPAVIIGAMLISPLMAPILGIGLGVGINDRSVIRSSLMQFTVAIIIAILASSVYFVITPLGYITPEIEARTHPTALDVLIAFFGGIAGIISIARKDISTTIPGVAIATALMPPLCVTGYGIANLDGDIILSSFYLFFSNTFFICLSTYLIVRLLNFPFRKYPIKKEQFRNRIFVVIFTLLVIVPSFFIMKKIVSDISVDRKIEAFLRSEFGNEKKYLDDYISIKSDSINELFLKVYGSGKKKNFEKTYEHRLDSMGLKNWKVTVLPTSEVNLDRIASLETQIHDVDKIFEVLDSLETISSTYKSEELASTDNLKQTYRDSIFYEDVFVKTKQKFPQIEEIGIGNLPFQNYSEQTKNKRDVLILKWKKNTDPKEYEVMEENLQFFLEGKIGVDSLLIIRVQS